MEEFVTLIQDGPLAASLDARLDPAIESDADVVQHFLQEGLALREWWSSFAQGVPSAEGRLVSFTFGPEQLPEGLERVREWLRARPFVRLIEVERYHPPI